jgi:hypothetical protein
MDLQELFHSVDELSADELKQLYLYITQTRIKFVTAQETVQRKARVLGLFESIGETWISDDFDAELPDSFWLNSSQGTF